MATLSDLVLDRRTGGQSLSMLARILKAGAAGSIGGVVGTVPDLGVNVANLLRAGYGYGGHKLGLLSAAQMPDPIDASGIPFTSEWISKKMGVGDSPEEQVAQFVGGFVSPGGKKPPAKMDWTAYHGSPHKFDQFDMGRIGTGEGAQTYGHGLYFADEPNVAKRYANNLALARDPRMAVNDLVAQMSANGPESATLDSVRWYMKQDRALRDHIGNDALAGHILDAVRGRSRDGSVSRASLGSYDEIAKHIPEAKPQFYKVDIDDIRAPKEAFLDLDKPMSRQSERVRAAATAAIPKEVLDHYGFTADDISEMSGKFVYGLIHKDPAQASAALRQSGIPGLRYLDEHSRPDYGGFTGEWLITPKKGQPYVTAFKPSDAVLKKTGATAEVHGGTRNTVLFDDSLVKILGRE